MGICLVFFLCFIYGYVDGSIQMANPTTVQKNLTVGCGK